MASHRRPRLQDRRIGSVEIQVGVPEKTDVRWSIGPASNRKRYPLAPRQSDFLEKGPAGQRVAEAPDADDMVTGYTVPNLGAFWWDVQKPGFWALKPWTFSRSQVNRWSRYARANAPRSSSTFRTRSGCYDRRVTAG